MNFACEIRELVAGDIVVVSYDVIDDNSLADWISPRMVKISKEAIDSCLAGVVKQLLFSRKTIDIQKLDEKMILDYFVKFCGFSSTRKMDVGSKMVFLIGNEKGEIEIIPTRNECKGGFSHKDNLAIECMLDSYELTSKIKEALVLSEAEIK